MPRIEKQSPIIQKWYDRPGNVNGTSTWDVCTPCFNKVNNKSAPQLKPYNGEPDDANAVVVDTLSGIDMSDAEGYCCALCDKKLTSQNY